MCLFIEEDDVVGEGTTWGWTDDECHDGVAEGTPIWLAGQAHSSPIDHGLQLRIFAVVRELRKLQQLEIPAMSINA
jgi:hypothetical protein